MTPDQLSAIRTFAHGLPSDGTAPDTAILELVSGYESLQSQLAAANERADGLQKIVDAARAQKPVAWCVAYDDSRMARIHSNPTMYRPEAQRIADNGSAPLTVVDLYAAAPVPAQPDVVPEGMKFPRKHVDGWTIDPEYLLWVKREIEANNSEFLPDMEEIQNVLMALEIISADKDAILSTTDTEVKGG